MSGPRGDIRAWATQADFDKERLIRLLYRHTPNDYEGKLTDRQWVEQMFRSWKRDQVSEIVDVGE